MSIVRKSENTKPCSTCLNNAANRWCQLYQSEITGSDALLQDARPQCQGNQWEERPWNAYPAFTITTGVSDDKIETPKATIYRDPPTKMYD